MKEPKEKSPYLTFTLEEIHRAEAGAYLIQLGTEFFDYRKRYSFTKDIADKFYEELLTGLQEMIHDPKNRHKNKDEVVTTIMSLRILPLRFH